MSLSKLLEVLEEGQIAKATFGEEVWYVKRKHVTLWYCNENGHVGKGNVVHLVTSNIEAEYEII